MPKTELILIRHAETSWNAQKRYSGFLDVPLSKKGIAQAQRLRLQLKKKPVTKIYTSDKARAITTARIAFKTEKCHPISELREMHFGIFEGLTHQEIMRKYPRIYRAWLEHPFTIAIPDGEKFSAFRKRVLGTFRQILARHPGERIAVVSHGGVISLFITHILNSKEFWKFIPKSASISIVEDPNNALKVKLFSDDSHLL
jgi:2,3-bisphosphoglycerate-dependent phosphoglycerate mutase